MLIGYAHASTEKQDLQVQREQLATYGVEAGRIYFDHGGSGRNTQCPGLGQAIAACRAGDTLVMTKLDLLASSVHDAFGIAPDLQQRGVALQIGCGCRQSPSLTRRSCVSDESWKQADSIG
ncbi:recombinase family protein [Corynebacterium silvaticum]|uniref:Recombinase family protein n=1 Tax=Corynebacterium silvaticum TaxID=2320431 RepID=A0A7Y4PAD0_9CORY|nr:recombinase family protein [Corynebacterium silvaticum]ARU46107.1 recombinase family protein [Corynebacterium silvaticum]MBH5299213.1 recombinase family protein [Corynebacterium silvaticum]NOM64466.1 recombinase family protein [Corynebacterium silvaticum]NON71144.1 recombinase family protein [Corynebacterium silvaticum]TFA91433.1 recombinase family protein [Corynebacterium silvaticum]